MRALDGLRRSRQRRHNAKLLTTTPPASGTSAWNSPRGRPRGIALVATAVVWLGIIAAFVYFLTNNSHSEASALDNDSNHSSAQKRSGSAELPTAGVGELSQRVLDAP